MANFVKGRSCYDILKISRLSKPEEIRSAYLELAKKYHPDSANALQCPDTQFHEIQEAYATLSNPWKRTLYDQDIQFHNALQSSYSGVSAWKKNFDLETPEARIARRERYRRYAAGERNDLPPPTLTTRGSLIGLVVCGAALTYVCAKAPEWFGGQGELTFHDPVFDDKSVSLVCAYFNPITRKWERLNEGQRAPSFKELLDKYRSYSPKLIDSWVYEAKKHDLGADQIETLTVINVPKTKTIPATVFKDESGALRVNRRTMNDAISRFIDRLD